MHEDTPMRVHTHSCTQDAALKSAEAAAAKQKAAAADAAAALPAKVLAQAIMSRGIKLTAPQVGWMCLL